MWINRIVATGLPTTHMNYTNVLCIVQKWQLVWSLFSWHYWSLFLWEYKGAYSNYKCRAVQIHAGNISAHWFTVRKICCVSNMMAQLLTQQKFPCRSSGQCFWANSFLVSGTSPGSPARLTMEYQTNFSGSTLKAGYMKHVLPIFLT
jgi:hypothetical protein